MSFSQSRMTSHPRPSAALGLYGLMLGIAAVPAFFLGAAGWTALVGFLGIVLSWVLGTHTALDISGKPTEYPGPLRELLLGDGTRPVEPRWWRAFLFARSLAALTLIVGFGLSLQMAVQAWGDAAAQEREIHKLQQDMDLLYGLPSVDPRIQAAYRRSRE